MDYYRLGLGTASSILRSMRIAEWGATVLLECVYDPLGERTPYRLAFRGCSRLDIEMAPGAVPEQDADLIGISLGQENGQQPAVLTTDLFEMQVTYQKFECQRGWHATAADGENGPAGQPQEIGPKETVAVLL